MPALLQSTANYNLHCQYCQAIKVAPMHEVSFSVAKPRARASHTLYWYARLQGLDNVTAEKATANKLNQIVELN